jgi:hypothetical protein
LAKTRKKHYVVEAKSIQIDLNTNHLKQARDYAANEGIDWVILSNGRQIELHRVLFSKPIKSSLVWAYDLSDLSTIRQAAKDIAYITKKATEKNELDDLWKRFCAINENSLVKSIYSEEVINAIKRQIKKSSGIYFAPEEIKAAVVDLISGKTG